MVLNEFAFVVVDRELVACRGSYHTPDNIRVACYFAGVLGSASDREKKIQASFFSVWLSFSGHSCDASFPAVLAALHFLF